MQLAFLINASYVLTYVLAYSLAPFVCVLSLFNNQVEEVYTTAPFVTQTDVIREVPEVPE